MIRHIFALLVVFWLAAADALVQNAKAQDAAQPFPTTPVTKPDGQRWRLGYVESGLFSEYPLTLRATINGLQQLGWLELNATMPDDTEAEALWQWLGQHARSDFIEFVPDAIWRPGNFDTKQRAPMRDAIQSRLAHDKDLDLLLAMGTWAGQDMRKLGPPVPVIVASVSDAVSAGIVDSIEDSGRDHLHARVEPQRYQRQVKLFHEIVPFDTLGVVYEDSQAGRTYAALDAIETVGQQLGFDVVHCHANASDIETEAATDNALNCYRSLADQQVDAVYVTFHRGITRESVATVAEVLREAGIPSFSMAGAQDVEQGLLLSLATANVSYVGLFHAEAIARVLNGALPRELDQVWVDPAKIALNLGTARIIGFDPPIDILLAADEVYESPLEK